VTLSEASFIIPDWPLPDGVLALSTTRLGGFSSGAWRGFNLGDHVGDVDEAVQGNREALQARLPGAPDVGWLVQVHGKRVLELGPGPRRDARADASWTGYRGLPCAVLTADCLPVLLCSLTGERVGAVHAGWRGLAAGVLEVAVAAIAVPGDELMAWLGPAIGPAAFEVGSEVRAAFLDSSPLADRAATDACFTPVAGRSGHYLADLPQLARIRLLRCGVSRLYGAAACTYSDADRFFSYRRDGQTGRMATLIMRCGAAP
jgi:YfiH family protein